jgi:hypothetical protein
LLRYLLLPVFLFLFFMQNLSAQQNATIFGKITDENSLPVPNINILVAGLPSGSSSDKNGHFEINVPSNKKITLTFTCVGFESFSLDIQLKPMERKEMNRIMMKRTTQLPSVEIRDEQVRTNTFNRLNPKTVTFIPTLNASIEDLIKTLPGVSSHNELSSQYSVRGGNYDENLVFVNDIEMYRPFLVRSGQQEGLSFLNPDLVSSISFSAGGFDAKFGDKMSSVLDIHYKKPESFAGSFDISLLGADGHLEGTITKKLSYLLGIRYKTYTYFLQGLDTKGDYKPKFFDVQGMLNYDVSKKVEISVMGTYSNNFYQLIPQTRQTNFGTLNEAYKLIIYFDGQEVDRYKNWLGALTLTYKPTSRLRLKLISSVYQANESETYDISGEYWIGQLETYQGSPDFGNVTEALGVGAYLQHARDYLNGTVFNFEHRGSYEMNSSFLQWGLKYEHQYFNNVMNEWDLQDSAGYSLPHPPDSLGYFNPNKQSLQLMNVVKGNNTVDVNGLSGFLQNTWTFKNERNDISITAGLRGMYWDFNRDFNLNPRAIVALKPHWKTEMEFHLAAGFYSQPPTFREMTDLSGRIVPGIKAQTALNIVGGTDLYFKAWDRPFKFVTEVYYKYLYNLIPYEIDNLKIRYYGTNDDHGYAAGIDCRINGEFVKGAESWASLSIMKTEEYYQGAWVPRPTDQRLNLSIFFQDYIPHYPSWRMNLALFYGTGLPFGPPNSAKTKQNLRMPPYRRVDIGLSKQIVGEYTRFSKKNPLRVIKSLWIALEVFNLLQISNTISYLWVTDINGRQYAVPNYLTPRQVNLKLNMTF